MTDNATVTLDTSGMPCPAPLLGAKKLVDDLQPGQVLKLISDCPGTADDLFAWAKYTGNQVLESKKLADGKTAYLIQRAGSAVHSWWWWCPQPGPCTWGWAAATTGIATRAAGAVCAWVWPASVPWWWS